MKTYDIAIKGTVQGVGFRPFVYNLADAIDIKGEIFNNSSGVTIIITASKDLLDQFITKIKTEKPPLSYIDSIDIKEIGFKEFNGFDIVNSESEYDKFTIMPPDISICSDCKKELNDPSNKRYNYPFINCTNCGPRYTIIKQLPYDRANTSMQKFAMCNDCKKEYTNQSDRRYHAQPIGCFKCGPKLSLWNNKCRQINSNDIIGKAAGLLKEGKILAVKGVGGYHLLCDATNDSAVELLRHRKNRPHKPFAVMVKDITLAKQIAKLSQTEEELLSSIQRPIVLLKKQNSFDKLSALIAPDINKIGIFLPYAPLYYLILQNLGRPIVATSANVSDEPICTTFKEIKKLNHIWDYCIEHDRNIVNGCDDSVAAVVKEQSLFFRRARGYAPQAVKLPFKLDKKILSLGANQKSTVAIGFEDNVILSPHIGDLNTIGSIEYFKQNIENLKRIYRFEPDIIVYDKHPNYESTKYARQFINTRQLQHHAAHIFAVMLEKKITSKVLGVAFDGTGYGDDGNLWGGEFLVCSLEKYERVAHIKYFKLLGGEKAVRQPRRVALSLLFEIYGKDAIDIDHPMIKSFSKDELNTLYISWQKGLNAPLSSSMGRLFDAVASLCDIVHIVSYEGQSGAVMENYYDSSVKGSFSWSIDDGIIDITSMIKEILEQNDKTIIVSRFFNTIVEIIKYIYSQYKYPLVISGGVFQNIVLLKLILDKIPEALFGNCVPPNDGAISLGQIIKGNN